MSEAEHNDTIRLGQFLKYSGIAETGGHARELIQAGLVSVDGEVETRRGRQLHDGMQVSVQMPDGSVEQAVVGEEIDVPW